MAWHGIPRAMARRHWSDAPQPDAEGTFALWLLRQTNKLDITRKAETSGGNLYTEVLECLETVENSEAEVSHARAVLDKIEQATKHILAAFSSDEVELAWKEMSADIPTSTWNWWEPSRDPRSLDAGKLVRLQKQEDEEPSLAIAKIKPEMLDLADCELPSISTAWGARFREIYFGGFIVPKEPKENQSNQGNTTTMHGIKGLFLCAHSILRHLWIMRRMAGRMRNYYSEAGLKEDITPLWREFGRLLGFTVMEGPGVYSSDINGIGKCGLVLQFPRIPNYVISVQFEVELGGPKSMTEFLSTLLALTSGLNFEDWVWEEKEDTQEQQQQQQQQEEGGGGKLPLQGPPPLLPTVLPIGLMLCPLGVVRAQYQAHSKRYVCDKHPSWKEHADELVFELLSRAMRYDDGNNNNNDEQQQQEEEEKEEEEDEAGCFELCSSPLPHDTQQEGKSSSRLADPSLLIHVNKQTPRPPAWIEEKEEEEEEGSEEGFDSQEEESNEDEVEHDSKRHKSAPSIDDRSNQGSTLNLLETADEGKRDAEKEKNESLLLQESNERVKQWPLNAYFLSQLGKFSRKENFERWKLKKTKRACVS